MQTDRVLVLELENPINSLQARICDDHGVVNRFDENKVLQNINLLPADVLKWPAILEDSFVREPAKWLLVGKSTTQVRIRLDLLKSRLMKSLFIPRDVQESQSRR